LLYGGIVSDKKEKKEEGILGELEALLLEGLNSGASKELTEKNWREFRSRVKT
jgi:hypothetical protein